MTREEADALLFGQAGLMYRGLENRMLALNAHALVVLHTDGTYEVVKNRHAGLTLGSRVEKPTVLYLERDDVRVLTVEPASYPHPEWPKLISLVSEVDRRPA